MANALTICRIIGSIVLLIFGMNEGLYVFCGVSDMLDGWIARKTHTASAFGAKLDSIADMVFGIAYAVRVLPMLALPRFVWIWAACILLMRIWNLRCGYKRTGHVVMPHTFFNKCTGFMLFLLPLMRWAGIAYIVAVCVVATAAAIQEGYFAER